MEDDEVPAEVERLLGGGPQAIAAKYQTELQLKQIKEIGAVKAIASDAKKSADRSAKWLLWLTVGLIVVGVLTLIDLFVHSR